MAVLHMDYRARFKFARQFDCVGLGLRQSAAALGVGSLYRPALSVIHNEKFFPGHPASTFTGTNRFTGAFAVPLMYYY
jgi:hypothetical protein